MGVARRGVRIGHGAHRARQWTRVRILRSFLSGIPWRFRWAAGRCEEGPGRTGEANAASCLPNGVPAVMGVPVGFEFLLTPGRLTILVEEGPTIRQVYLDRKEHTPDADPSYTGESIGHWEGQTLVVDTTAISPKAQFFFGVPTSGKTHLIERIHLIDHDHLKIDTEVDDPIALQKPWHYSWTYVRTDTDFMANTCDKLSDRDRNGEPDLTPPTT